MSDRRYVKAYIGWWEEDWINVLSAEAQLAWVKLQERAKTHGIGGQVPKFNFKTVCIQWLQSEESIRQVIRAAELAGKITDDGDHWQIVEWRRDQGDETGAERQKRFRQTQNSNDSNALRNARNTEFKESSKRGEIKKEPSVPKKVFVVPAVSECEAYAEAIGLPRAEGTGFFDFWTSAGWERKSTGRMKDWKASLRTWKKNYTERRAKSPQGQYRPSRTLEEAIAQ